MSCPGVKYQTQLNNPNSTTDGDDCAVIAISEAHDFASCGRFRPTVSQIRGLDGVPNTGGLTMAQFRTAMLGFPGRYSDLGLAQPGVSIKDDGPWDDCYAHLMNPDEVGTKWMSVFIDYGVWNDLCTEYGRNLSGDREFRGTHAISARKGRQNDDGQNVYDAWDPLYDGRKDQPSNKKVPKGKQVAPVWWLRDAAAGRAGTGEVEYAMVTKAKSLEPGPPTPPPDPCAQERAAEEATLEDLEAILEAALDRLRGDPAPGTPGAPWAGTVGSGAIRASDDPAA